MCNRIVQSVVLAVTLFLVPAIPVVAADGAAASIGLSFLGDDGGAGLAADYSRPLRTTSSDMTVGWVGDVSYHHNGDSAFGLSASLNTFMVQGGARIAGKAGDKATWHAQGTFGVAHQSIGGSLGTAACEILDTCSSNSAVFTPAGALTYWFSGNKGVKGQLGIPVFFSGGGDTTTRFDISFVWGMGK